MNCERFENMLPDYLAGSLGHEEEDRLEQHIEQCAQCKEIITLWHKLGELPQEQPSPALRARFEAMLHAYQEGQTGMQARTASARQKFSPLAVVFGSGSWGRVAAAAAFAVVLLVIGFSAGRYTGAGSSQSNELAVLRAEMTSMRQLMVLSMLQQQSASQRLQGVAWGTQQGQPDPKILAALLDTLRLDSSVDVRLAALNALAKYGSQPMVRAGLVDSLYANQSPMVQVALIDLLVELRDTNAVPELQRVQHYPDLNPAVRQRAEWALRELK